MARPRLDYEVTEISLKLRLHPGRDDDLITFFNSLESRERAQAVMAAMRGGDLGIEVESGDEEAMLTALEEMTF